MNEIKCDKCHKYISKEYFELSYKIINNKGEVESFKGKLCRKCLNKLEDKIGTAETIIRVSETARLHKLPKKIYHKKKQSKS